MKRVFFILTMFFLFQNVTGYAKILVIDSEKQFSFANELMQKGDFDYAILELKRFIYFFPDDPKVPQARCLIGICYMRSGRYEKARGIFSDICKSHRNDKYAQKALFLIGESYYKQKVFDEAEYYFSLLIQRFPKSELYDDTLYRLGWIRMYQDKWKEASKIFSQIRQTSPYYEKAKALAKSSLKGETLPYKSPTLAGVLSAVFPGAGHAYVGRYKDGCVAFLLNGVFIMASMEAFHEDMDVMGGMLGFLELGWYTGSIYSAINVTHKYNRKLQMDFLGRFKDNLYIEPFMGLNKEKGVSIKLRFNF
ncbi:MAG: hypothetical protein DRG39_02280 [Deltaproteobacteria bacterium]|nr:MAG: hypothetical protein DRG39_02280 [Deltaproteobacteria bacterium]